MYSLTVTIISRRQRRARRRLVLFAATLAASTLLMTSMAMAQRVDQGPKQRPAALTGTLTISVASSLTSAFSEIVASFHRTNPRLKIRLNVGASSTLVAQIQSGAPSDLLAAADLASFDKLVASGDVQVVPKVFARNSMQIAVKPTNPLNIKTLADLARVGVLSLCNKSAPCGAYADAVLRRAGVTITESKVSRGADAMATLNAVGIGDAQAAIVYVTDVLAAKKRVLGIAIPIRSNIKAMYGVAPIRGSKMSAAVNAFVSFLVSRAGQAILKTFGFLPA